MSRGLSQMRWWEIGFWAAVLLLAVFFLLRSAGSNLLEPGTPIPAFSAERLGGGREPVSRDGMLGRPAVMFFWAAWCPHCKPMLPELNDLAARRRELSIVAVHTDASVDPAIVEAAARAYPALLFLPSSPGMARSFRAETLPTTYVVGRDGKVCQGFSGRTGIASIAVAVDRCR